MLAQKTVEKYENLQIEHNLSDYVLCMQNGIFFNIIGEDAELLTEILGLKKQVNSENISYIGFPVNTLEKYVGRILLNKCNIAVYGKTQSFSNQEGMILKAEIKKAEN
ncbi:MAG: hypothetical protein HQ554_06850 [FCB group bacterium]|nr:hypothetical protein [FCB group bacterium]